jgi:hypothetical protein
MIDPQLPSPDVRPRQIRIEASSACQLRCPSCPTTNKGASPVIGSGWLTFEHFQKLVDGNPWVEEIELSNYGDLSQPAASADHGVRASARIDIDV